MVRFKEAAEAFEVLSDAEKRARYDRFGHAGVDGAAGRRSSTTSTISSRPSATSSATALFGDLFGGGGGRRRAKGADVRCDVTLDLLEAARGVTKTVEFERHESCDDCDGTGAKPGTSRETCRYCGGRGQVVQSTGIFRVQTTCPSCHGAGSIVKDPCTDCRGAGFVLRKVTPRGADSGRRRRPDAGAAAGRRRAQPQRRPARRLLLLYHGQGASAVSARGAAPDRAQCRSPIRRRRWARVEVPTLDGPHELKVPAGTQTGRSVQAARPGHAHPRGRGVGDLLVQVQLEVPKPLSPAGGTAARAGRAGTRATSRRTARAFFEKLRELLRRQATSARERGGSSDDRSESNAARRRRAEPVDDARPSRRRIDAGERRCDSLRRTGRRERSRAARPGRAGQLRKRARRELEDERRYANLPLLRDLLPVLDNIQRAIEAAEKSPSATSCWRASRWWPRAGRRRSRSMHCKRIEALHQPFDPAFHQAISQQPSDEYPPQHGAAGGAGRLHVARPRGAAGAGDRFHALTVRMIEVAHRRPSR